MIRIFYEYMQRPMQPAKGDSRLLEVGGMGGSAEGARNL